MLVAPSLLSANASNLGQAITAMADAGADRCHIDVMDGLFAPDFSFGRRVVSDLRGANRIPFDVHLMVTRPEEHIKAFIDAGADAVIVHVETVTGELVSRLAATCHHQATEFGLAVSPKTPVGSVASHAPSLDWVQVMSIPPGTAGSRFLDTTPGRILELSKLRADVAGGFRIGVDGGINPTTAALCRAAGADLVVSGGYLFKQPNLATAIAALR